MNFASAKNYFVRWRKREMNPILLKELRQASRSNVFIGMLLLVPVAMLLVAIVTMSTHEITDTPNKFLGQQMFGAFLAALAIISLVFLPLYTGIRFAMERQEPDLMFFTLLSEAKMVRGKFSSGIYLAGLFFSVCLPFMAFSSLFAGVDFMTILFVLAVLFSVVCFGNLAALAIATVPVYLVVRIFFGLGFTVALAAVCGLLLTFLSRVIQAGVGTMFHSGDFCSGFFATFFFAILAGGWLYAISVTSIGVLRSPRKYPRRRNEQLTNE